MISGEVERGEHELLHERALANRVGWVRVALCALNFGVLYLDYSTPHAATSRAIEVAAAAAGVFLLYAVAWLVLVARERTPMLALVIGGVFADITCASLLILSTDGYLSPFNLWLVFAVVASGYSRFRLLPVLATSLGILAHVVIAQVPQFLPLQTGVFAVRTGYLYGFANILAFLGSRLAAQSHALDLVERAGRRMGQALTLEAIAAALTDSVKQAGAPSSVSVEFANGEQYPASGHVLGLESHKLEFPLECSGGVAGTLRTWWHRPPAQDVQVVLKVLSSRAAASAIRIILTQGMSRSAAREERARLADEIHDSMLQTLAAIDLRAEAARNVLLRRGGTAKALKDVDKIKEISQQAADDLRSKICEFAELQPAGRASIEDSLKERWPGTLESAIPYDLELSDDAWQLLMAMVREGTSNALEHGQGTHLRFQVVEQGDLIEATMSHIGMPISAPIEYGFGLKRLDSMARAAGGWLRLTSSEDGCTDLTVCFRRDFC